MIVRGLCWKYEGMRGIRGGELWSAYGQLADYEKMRLWRRGRGECCGIDVKVILPVISLAPMRCFGKDSGLKGLGESIWSQPWHSSSLPTEEILPGGRSFNQI